MRHTESLLCDLNNDELRERGQEAANLQQTRDRLEAERSAAQKEAKGEVESVEAKVRHLLGEIRSKTTHRDIEVIEERDIENGMMLSVRVDTGEVIRRRQLSENEMTRPLPFPIPSEAAGAGEASETAGE